MNSIDSHIKRIVLTGPESVGKTFLTEALAEHYQTNYVKEYGREYVEKFGTDFNLLDISLIAGGQLYYEDKAVDVSNKVLFCDTDLIVTKVWSELVLGESPRWIDQFIKIRQYDLWLLLDIDWPWEADGTRKFENLRAKMFYRIHEILRAQNKPFHVISGTANERLSSSIAAIDETLEIDTN